MEKTEFLLTHHIPFHLPPHLPRFARRRMEKWTSLLALKMFPPWIAISTNFARPRTASVVSLSISSPPPSSPSASLASDVIVPPSSPSRMERNSSRTFQSSISWLGKRVRCGDGPVSSPSRSSRRSSLSPSFPVIMLGICAHNGRPRVRCGQ